MSQKKITFIVTADTKNADASFAKLEAEARKLGMALDGGGTKKAGSLAGGVGNANFAMVNLGRVVSDLPYGFIAIQNNIDPLVSSFAMMKQESGGLKGALITLKNSMMGPAGLFLAFQIVTSAITMFMLSNRGGKKSVDEHTASLKAQKDVLIQLKSELEAWERKAKEMPILSTNDPRVTASALRTTKGFQLANLLIEQANLKNNPFAAGATVRLKEIAQEIPKVQKEIRELEEITMLWDAQIRNAKSRFRELTDGVKELKDTTEDYYELLRRNPLIEEEYSTRARIDEETSINLWDVPGKKPKLRDLMAAATLPGEKELREKFVLFDAIADSAAQTMRQNFSQAWNDIFGEANSLFEQFMQNIASSLLSLAANWASGGIFNFLKDTFFPSGKPSTIVLEVDGTNMGTYITKQLPAAINRNMRLKAL